MKVEMPSTATTTAATEDGGGDGDVSHCCDYGSPKEDVELKVIDVYYHPLKEEPEAELGDGDGDATDINGHCDFDPPKEEPELVATGDDTDDDGGRDVGYDCSHCGISLSTQKFKVEHELRCKVRVEQKEFESQLTKLYHCCYCRCPFVNEEYREQHQHKYCRKRPVAKRMDSNDSYLGCDKCEFVTKNKKYLKCHLLRHNKNNAKWFTCTQCSYKTVRKYCLSRHMEIHNNTFSCCCPICGKSFRAKWCLDDHLLRQHSDESEEVSKLITNKIYTCDICNKYTTTLKTNFNRHLTVKHLKGVGCQKYECPRCPYSSFYKGNLMVHSKTHLDRKDYRCTVCKKQFARKMELDSHILHSHADNVDSMKTITTKVHSCESCSYKTVRKYKLNKHVQSKHI